MNILIDAHQDLAYNALTLGRDYTRSAAEIRAREQGSAVLDWNHGHTVLGWPEYQRGRVGLVFGTLFAPPARFKEGEWDRLGYRNPAEALRSYRANLDYYQRLFDEHPDKFLPVGSRAELDLVLEGWAAFSGPGIVPRPANANGADGAEPQEARTAPVGVVLSMEGAEAIREPAEVEEWWAAGLRLIGPAWVGANRYTGGNKEPGPLTPAGRELLAVMDSFGFGLDVTHMAHAAVYDALDTYNGPIIASHSNPAALLRDESSQRFLPDRILAGIIEHGGVIGIVPFNKFIKPGWDRSLRDAKNLVTLQDVAAHIDYVCQIAGDARHVAFGTDFDGGFGLPDVPAEVDTIADLRKLEPLLAEKGYNTEDISAIFGGNWVSILQRILPAA